MVSYSEALSSKFPALVQTSDAAGTHGFVRGCHLYRFLGCVLVLYGDLWAFWACLGIRAARFTVRSMWGEVVVCHPGSAGYARM